MKFKVSDEIYYTRNGEWIQVEENLVTVGLTDFRLHELCEVLFLDLPEELRSLHVRGISATFMDEDRKSANHFSRLRWKCSTELENGCKQTH